MRVGRYAPSPTGGLHLGNLLAAVVAHAWTRRAGDASRMLLRIEDLDSARCPPEATAMVLDELAAFGFDYDATPRHPDAHGPYIQSECGARYIAALLHLKAQGLLFACECSRKDLLAMASAPHVGDEGPPYPGTCRHKNLPFDDPAVPVAWRFDPPPGVVSFDDAFCGRVEQDVATDVGAFVVRRKDDVIAYHLAVVVDDGAQGVTEVVRGNDLLSSTPRQIRLQQALSLPTPSYAHGPLLVDASGQRFAKRRGDSTLSALFERQSPEALLGVLGHALGVVPKKTSMSLEALIGLLRREHFQRASVSLSAF